VPPLFIFSLCPDAAGLGDPDWTRSRFRGECLVAAADESEARGFAQAECDRPPGPAETAAPARSPWRQSRLVRARRLNAPMDDAAGLRGRVMFGASGSGTWSHTGSYAPAERVSA